MENDGTEGHAFRDDVVRAADESGESGPIEMPPSVGEEASEGTYGGGRWRKYRGVATVPRRSHMTPGRPTYAVCISNEGHPASLEVRKLYVVLPDEDAARHGMLRVVDESGEDYLYPASHFVPIELPPAVTRALGQ